MKASELFDLSGTVALVTGASSGLGRRFAQVLAANGAHTVCVARRRERLDALVDAIGAAGGSALAVAADVTDRDAMRAAFDAAERRFGTVTLLVNNAGIAQVGRAADQPTEVWRSTLDVNLDAVYFNAQLAAQRLIATGKAGAIVNIASVLGLGVGKGVSAYAVAKAAVIQLTRALALETGPRGVRVNAIAPGYFETEINGEWLASGAGHAIRDAVPLRRLGAEGDLDGVLLLLASRAGAYINGATYVVDGGQTVGLKGL